MKYLILAALVCVLVPVSAQDIHFSQFYQSPLTLNPALTGVTPAATRLTALYRNQWEGVLGKDAFKTAAVSYDCKLPIGQYDFIGIGGSLWADKAGEANYQSAQADFTFSYLKRIGGSRKSAHYLSAGGGVGFGQRSYDWSKLRWGTQFDPGMQDFNAGLDPLEFPRSERIFYPDLSAGLLWWFASQKNSAYAGLSMSHLNRPKLSFEDNGKAELPTKTTIHIGAEVSLNRSLSLTPSLVVFSQHGAFELNAGSSVKFRLDSDRRRSFQFGGWMRFGDRSSGGWLVDAVILNARFEMNGLGLGFSYDANLSPLREAKSGNGALEMSLTYLIDKAVHRNVFCPAF
jgi:type IX secretion system PorP/SprF family membrane protein